MNAHIKHEKMTLNDTIDIETDTVQHGHHGKVPELKSSADIWTSHFVRSRLKLFSSLQHFETEAYSESCWPAMF